MKVSNDCHRCYAPIRVSIMSKLNTDILCMAFKDDEKALPSYRAGDEAELKPCAAATTTSPVSA